MSLPPLQGVIAILLSVRGCRFTRFTQPPAIIWQPSGLHRPPMVRCLAIYSHSALEKRR
jgi:hypothetical protein